ncbi:spermidine/putrescine ABC transporter substrate-binding protein [Microterricola viridarii]|uniref:Spermidine/putrescine ABC transporter substrate-binding protein n=1 Tax=Microterricola viridarii TaxID=412690 RepID=A0A120I0T7_9MICO|nr:spermidine/putrescine ABC transporter substrate-binding protein [Microterricola viridarii]AMB57664.1 spermidine/putrescine ABC transporter substrate-binding protein [Microterricola viridarii]
MEGSIEARVSHEVDLWLRWLPKWQPGTHRARMRLCRSCFGSPVIAAAGLATDVPHAVQHGMSMRMKLIVDAAVDDYTDRNLPLLQRELDLTEQRRRAQQYRPADGLAPESAGLDLDPEPEAGQPFLFTLGELAATSVPDVVDDPNALDFPLDEPAAEPQIEASGRAGLAEPPPLSPEEKAAIRAEVRLADEFADQVGQRVCAELVKHRGRIAEGVAQYVEPQVAALLADLGRELDSPIWPTS